MTEPAYDEPHIMQQSAPNEAGTDTDTKGPTYLAVQYRVVRVRDEWKTRKERIGAAFVNAMTGAICLRPAGKQIIENDIYLFPIEDGPA